MADIETFDLYEMATGATYPEDSVFISMDHELAYKISKIDQEINNEAEDAKVVKLEKEQARLHKQFDKTKLEVVIKGLPPFKRDSISDKLDSEFGIDAGDRTDPPKAFIPAWTADYFLASIKEVKNTEGLRASVADWDREKMQEWIKMVPDFYNAKILGKIEEMTLQAKFYEDVEVSTDF